MSSSTKIHRARLEIQQQGIKCRVHASVGHVFAQIGIQAVNQFAGEHINLSMREYISIDPCCKKCGRGTMTDRIADTNQHTLFP